MKSFLGASTGSWGWRLLVAATAVALLAAAIAFGGCVTTEEVEDTSSPTVTQEIAASATATPAVTAEPSAVPGGVGAEAAATSEEVVSPTTVPQEKGDAIERAKQATEADRVKPRFRGELGDFVIVGPGVASGYPCPEPYEPATNLEDSELYFSLPGAVIDMAGSCQGTVFGITAGVPHGAVGAMVGRGYFLGPKLEEPINAPAERLKLITVAGKPALAELPIADCMVCTSQVVVIQRFPTEAAPGITVWAQTTNDLDGAIGLAEQIMGQ